MAFSNIGICKMRVLYKECNHIEINELQKALIEQYLPKLMSEDDIRKIISSLEDKSMPSVMKHFKMNYDGQVDMSVVSRIARGQ